MRDVGEGVGVVLDWLRGIAIFIRSPALSELITLNCCGFSGAVPPVLCLLLVLFVDADDESESLDESVPSSESEDEEEVDDEDRGDLALSVWLVVSVELLFTMVILLHQTTTLIDYWK